MPDGSNQVATVSNHDLATMPLEKAIDAYAPNFRAVLPAHVPLDHFKRMVVTAINVNPDLAEADRRTLFNAAVKCASDGLLPDGREAALVVYNTKVKDRAGNEHYIKAAQYLPMIAGIRKRMRNTGEVLSAEAHVVYSNDRFHREFGDSPRILHEPPPLDAERGDPVGAYAIIKLANGEILREVMPKRDIDRARAVSRSRDKGPWKDWWDEMARKTVLRRCAKAAPGSSALERLLARDEEEPELPDPEETPMIPPRPRREDFIEQDTAIETRAFEVVDFTGETNEYQTEMEAMEALVQFIAGANSLKVLEALVESNAELAAYPVIIEAYKDRKEVLSNPGNRQDRPAAGAQLSDPARGATIPAETGHTEHPGKGSTPPHQEKGDTAKVVENVVAPASSSASTLDQTREQQPPPFQDNRSAVAPHAPRDESFWSQKEQKLDGATAKEILYYAQKYLGQCRDEYDVNAIEMYNAERTELSTRDRAELAGLIAQRRKEIG